MLDICDPITAYLSRQIDLIREADSDFGARLSAQGAESYLQALCDLKRIQPGTYSDYREEIDRVKAARIAELMANAADLDGENRAIEENTSNELILIRKVKMRMYEQYSKRKQGFISAFIVWIEPLAPTIITITAPGMAERFGTQIPISVSVSLTLLATIFASVIALSTDNIFNKRFMYGVFAAGLVSLGVKVVQFL